MRATEQLAALTAIQKAVKERIIDVRDEVDDEMWDSYESDGVEKKALKVGGEKVGEITIAYSTETIEVTDMDALEEFALDYGFARIERSIKPSAMARAVELIRESVSEDELSDYIEERVELDGDWKKRVTSIAGVPFYEGSTVMVPGVRYIGRKPKGTRVTGCKPDTVLPLMQSTLGGAEELLIGDGYGD